jgi:molecular chaperone Hsp33
MTAKQMTNQLHTFVLPQRGVRGFAVEITTGIAEMLGWRKYPDDIVRLLGEALAATPLLAADLRAEARMNLQFQGKKDLKLLVTQIDQDLNLRGMAELASEQSGAAERDFQALMRGGLLACVMEPRSGGQRYQAVVDVLGDSLAEALEIYFAHSEQLPTLIRLAAGPQRMAGLFVQKLPEGGRDEDDWNTVKALFGTLGQAELLATDATTVLRRLFAEEELRLAEARPVTLACQCSHAGISAMLLALGEQELEPVLKERGHVEVTCEFCGREYRYPDVEVRQLFAAAQAESGASTIQ